VRRQTRLAYALRCHPRPVLGEGSRDARDSLFGGNDCRLIKRGIGKVRVSAGPKLPMSPANMNGGLKDWEVFLNPTPVSVKGHSPRRRHQPSLFGSWATELV